MTKSRRTSDLVNSILVNPDNSVNIHEGTESPYFLLTTGATTTPEQGMLFWDADRQTAGLQMNGVEARLGQDNFWYVKNQSGSDILKGTVVMAVGALGASSRILVAPMVADGSVEEQYLLGITAEDILNGEDGFVMNIGKIRGIDTTQYGTQAGQVLYCDPANPGGLTITQPDAPNLSIPIAFTVDYKSNGTLAVRVNPGYHIGELHDVYSNSPSNNDILLYNSTNSRWENTPLSSAVPTPTLQEVTDAGNTTTNAINVGTITSVGSAQSTIEVGGKQFQFKDGGGLDAILSTNYNNFRIKGNNNDGLYINLAGHVSVPKYLAVGNTYPNANTPPARLTVRGSGTTSSTTALLVENSSATASLVVNDAGNVLIGTTTDAGYKLDVNGTARVVDDAIINGVIVGKGGGSILTNTVLGQETFGSNNTGDENTAIGYGALKDNTSGNRNVALGTNAARVNTTGSYNAALGRDSLRFNTTGSQNSGVGVLALYLNTTGNYNTAVGYRAGLSNTTGSGNVFIGYKAGEGIADSNKLYIANNQTAPLIYGDFSTGNVMIGTTTDAGYKLDVNGSARLNGLSSINRGSVANTALAIGANGTGAGNFIIQGYDISSNQRFYITASGNFRINGAANNNTSGFDEKFRLDQTFNPTSGTGSHIGMWLRQTINQTGGANGITRGLYVSPTLTSAYDFRAIETTAGKVIHQGLTNATHTDQVYYDSATGELTYGAAGVAGSGTNNYLPVWTDSDTIGSSRVVQESTGLKLFGLTGSTYNRLQVLSPDTGSLALFELTHGSDENNASAVQFGRGDSFPTINSFSRGTGTTKPITFAINGSEKMRVATSGNVLIGTTTDAGYKLDVNGTFRVTDDLRLEDNKIIRWGNQLGIQKDTYGPMSIYGGVSSTTGGIDFYYYNNAYLQGIKLDNNGNVGIGTTSPSSLLTINSADTLATGITFDNAGSKGYLFGSGSAMILRAGSTHGITISTASASLQAFNSAGNFYINLQAPTALPIYAFYQDADTGMGRPSADTLALFANGEKMRIASTGNVLIGTTTDSGYKLDVNGTLRTTSAYLATSTSDRVGIGTTTPSEKLEIDSGTSNDVLIKIQGKDGTHVSSGIYSGIGALGTQGGFALKSARGTSSDLANVPAFASYLTTISPTVLLLGTDSKRRMLFHYQGDISTYLDDDTTVGMFWDASAGNLGIGTTSPLQPLHIATNNNNTDLALRVSNDYAFGRAGISFSLPNNSSETYSLGVDNDRYFKIANGASLATNTRVAISPAGNVLINTSTDAGYKLDVNGTVKATKLLLNTTNTSYTLYSNGQSRLNGVVFQQVSGTDYLQKASGTGGFYVRNTVSGQYILVGADDSSGQFTNFLRVDGANNDVTIRTNNTNRFYIGSSGNVGIGTTTPATKLDVNGTANATDFSANGVAGYTGTVTIQQPSPLPSINIDINGGIITNVY